MPDWNHVSILCASRSLKWPVFVSRLEMLYRSIKHSLAMLQFSWFQQFNFITVGSILEKGNTKELAEWLNETLSSYDDLSRSFIHSQVAGWFFKELASQLWGRSSLASFFLGSMLLPPAVAQKFSVHGPMLLPPAVAQKFSAHGSMLLPPAVAQKSRLRFVQLLLLIQQLRAVSRCCIVFARQRLTIPRMPWFMCCDCTRLSAMNKAGKLGEEDPFTLFCSSIHCFRFQCLAY